MAAVPAQAHPLPWLEERHIGGHRVHDSGNLMAGNPRIDDAGKNAELGDCIAVADTACLHANAHLAGTRLRKLFLNHLKGSARCGNLYCTAKYGRHSEDILLRVG